MHPRSAVEPKFHGLGNTREGVTPGPLWAVLLYQRDRLYPVAHPVEHFSDHSDSPIETAPGKGASGAVDPALNGSGG